MSSDGGCLESLGRTTRHKARGGGELKAGPSTACFCILIVFLTASLFLGCTWADNRLHPQQTIPGPPFNPLPPLCHFIFFPAPLCILFSVSLSPFLSSGAIPANPGGESEPGDHATHSARQYGRRNGRTDKVSLVFRLRFCFWGSRLHRLFSFPFLRSPLCCLTLHRPFSVDPFLLLPRLTLLLLSLVTFCFRHLVSSGPDNVHHLYIRPGHPP